MRSTPFLLVLAACGAGSLPVPDEADPDPVVDPTVPEGEPGDDDDDAPDTAEPTVPEADGCAGLLGAPGDSERTVPIDGDDRTFLVHVPPDLDPNAAVPVVLVFHGYTMSGALMAEMTSWSAVADREGFVVVYADGQPARPWNVGEDTCGSGALISSESDDFAFVAAMLDSVAADQCVDRDRVFGSGFSMGGYFVHNLACRGPGIVRAIAPHSGGTYTGACDNGPVPVLILHGTFDPIIAYDCGEEAAVEWIARNGCDEADLTTLPVEGGSCELHQACLDEGDVSFCTFDGMDHGWAGSTSFLYGGGAQYADAAELSWTFFALFP